jgi:hypothetical protein
VRPEYRHAVTVFNTRCFITATIVTRTQLNVTLHVHCLSYITKVTCIYFVPDNGDYPRRQDPDAVQHVTETKLEYWVRFHFLYVMYFTLSIVLALILSIFFIVPVLNFMREVRFVAREFPRLLHVFSPKEQILKI